MITDDDDDKSQIFEGQMVAMNPYLHWKMHWLILCRVLRQNK